VARSEDAHLGADIPEADRLEQSQPADHLADQQPEWPLDAAMDVDEADRLEQTQAVIGDPDEEYTPFT
jgi:hypothetical protein